MTETVTIVGSLAGLDLRATNGARVRFSIRYAPAGGAIEGDPVDGVTLPGPEYAPSIFTGTAWASTSAAGAWGRVLPWQEGAVIAVDVPGSGVRVAVCGTGPGEVPAGATVNFVDLPGAETLVEAPSTITATVAAEVEDYLTAHPPSGGGGVTDHGALTGLADDAHPQYALDADVTTALAGKVGLTDIRLTDARTPTPHAASHAAAGTDPLTLTKADVGLGNVDNTSDANKPVSTAQQAAIDGKVSASIVDTKGDLIAATANDTVARLPVGANGQVLTADSTQATGLKWAAPSGGNPITYGNTTVTDAQLNLGAGSVVSVADRIGAAFLPVPYAITSIGVSVSTAVSGATGDLVLYTRSDGTFTRHTNFGSIGLSTTGLKTLTGSWTLPAGEFWIGVLGTSAATGAALNGMPVPSNVPIPIRDPGNGGAVAVVGFTAGAGAVPPAAFTTSSYGPYWQGNPPAIYFRGGPA